MKYPTSYFWFKIQQLRYQNFDSLQHWRKKEFIYAQQYPLQMTFLTICIG